MGAKELGATVACCGGNPLTTQDDIASFLASQGIHVYAWHGQSVKDYDWCIDQVLKHKPTIAPINRTEVSFVMCKQNPKVIPFRGFDFLNRLIVLSRICMWDLAHS